MRIAPCLALIGMLTAAAAAPAEDLRRPKKLIETGWDMPDTATLRANVAAMEQRPFDGVVIRAVGRDAQHKPRQLGWAFTNQAWQPEWFQNCVDDLKACRFTRLKDNFLQFNANPGDVDWFDDDGFRQITAHWQIAGRIARQAGVRGILFDPEPYAPPHAQFHYAAQPQHAQHTFAEYWAKARQRGREAMTALAAEFPDAVLFCYFMDSVVATAADQADAQRALERMHYGLYPAYIDGWLDAAPPTITFVDGCESAYRYNSPLQFLQAAVTIKGDCQNLVAAANRAKYRAQVQVSYGIYLDAYWNPSGPWYVDGLGGPRVERLRCNTRDALRSADEYVWVYGEKFRWWPTAAGNVKPETWPEALPGSEDALRFARDPLDYGRTKIAALQAAGTLVNLVRNGDFAAEALDVAGHTERWRPGGRPVGWSSWQDTASHGTFAWDREAGHAAKGSACAAGVANGCFLQAVECQPGERFAVRAFRRCAGHGDGSIRVRWQTAAGKWIAEDQDRMLLAPAPTTAWGELFGVVEVPPGVGKLVLLLEAGGQTGENDRAWFDDVEVYRLDGPAAPAQPSEEQR